MWEKLWAEGIIVNVKHKQNINVRQEMIQHKLRRNLRKVKMSLQNTGFILSMLFYFWV